MPARATSCITVKSIITPPKTNAWLSVPNFGVGPEAAICDGAASRAGSSTFAMNSSTAASIAMAKVGLERNVKKGTWATQSVMRVYLILYIIDLCPDGGKKEPLDSRIEYDLISTKSNR